MIVRLQKAVTQVVTPEIVFIEVSRNVADKLLALVGRVNVQEREFVELHANLEQALEGKSTYQTHTELVASGPRLSFRLKEDS